MSEPSLKSLSRFPSRPLAASPGESSIIALWKLARICGVSPAYRNVLGEWVRADPESVLKVLQCLGAGAAGGMESIEDSPEALRREIIARSERLIEPVIVVWEGKPAAASLQLGPREAGSRIECVLSMEDGEEERWWIEPAAMPTERAWECDGRPFIRKRLKLPDDLTPGYHQLLLHTRGRQGSAHVFAAPSRAFGSCQFRGWGAFMPLYALWSGRSWGAGDLTDLALLGDWVEEHGGHFVGTLPLLASYLDEPCEPSPYTPVSRLFWNEFYLDVTASPEFETCAAARERLGSASLQEECRSLRAAPLVDYRRIMRAKRGVLELLAEEFFCRPSQRRAALEDRSTHDPDWLAYARFRAVAERQGAAWRQWPAPARHDEFEPGSWDENAERYHLYAQWLVREQLEAAANRVDAPSRNLRRLYLDLPVGVHPDGYDTWRYPGAFIAPGPGRSASAGAPPDEFFTHGQSWGIAPLHPHRTREDGHAYFRACVRHHMEFAGILRLDHIMWLHRLYWVPDGAAPAGGVYVRYPAEELYAILSIESHRRHSMIVGENLGTVPANVNRTMARRGIRPLYVAQFEFTPGAGDKSTNQPINTSAGGDDRAQQPAPVADPLPRAVASLNTHDMPTFAAFWNGEDIDQRVRLGLLDERDADGERESRAQLCERLLVFSQKKSTGKQVNTSKVGDTGPRAALLAMLARMAASEAGFVLVNLEDLWLETQPHNTPGSTDGTTWRRKSRLSLEEITNSHEVREAIGVIDLARAQRRKEVHA